MNIRFFVFCLFLAAVVTIGYGYYSAQEYKTGFELPIGDSPFPKKKTPASGLRIGKNAIYVNDQKPGKSVTIRVANIERKGYVVIHESADEKHGAIIGKSVLLDPGETTNFTAPLSRLSRDGEELIAMLHNNNGNGIFHPAEDQPVKDAEGNIIFMIFPVSEEAEESDGMISL